MAGAVGGRATHFAARHRGDGLFHLLFVAAAWISIGFGFSPQITLRFTGAADYSAPPILVLHVWAFFAWMTILSAQVVLVRLKRQDLHRLLGLSIVALIPVMTASALIAEGYSQRFYAPKDPENARFFIVPLLNTLMFAATATLAFLKRSDPAAHKRYIMLATAVILAAAFGRWWGETIEGVAGKGWWGILLGNWAGTLTMIAAAALYDRATRGRVHPVLLRGGTAYAAIYALASSVYFTDFWPALVRRTLGLAGA